MNDRIRELMIEAGLGPISGFESGRGVIESSYEKFAELIIQECADVADAGIDPAESHLIGNDILNHFGVEK